jgi:hypothetical protein
MKDAKVYAQKSQSCMVHHAPYYTISRYYALQSLFTVIPPALYYMMALACEVKNGEAGPTARIQKSRSTPRSSMCHTGST